MIDIIKRAYRNWIDRRNERELFLTHTPDAFKVGEINRGRRITRIRRTASTALAAGGVAPCWQVMGVVAG